MPAHSDRAESSTLGFSHSMQCSSEATEETDKYIMPEVYILLYAENIPFLHVSGRDADFSIKEYLLTQLVEMFAFSQPHLFFFFFFHSSNSQPYTASLRGKVTAPHLCPCHAPVAACPRAVPASLFHSDLQFHSLPGISSQALLPGDLG